MPKIFNPHNIAERTAEKRAHIKEAISWYIPRKIELYNFYWENQRNKDEYRLRAPIEGGDFVLAPRSQQLFEELRNKFKFDRVDFFFALENYPIAIPDTLQHVHGDCLFPSCNITSIPANLKIDGDFVLSSKSGALKSIPSGIKVKYSAEFTTLKKLEHISKDFVCTQMYLSVLPAEQRYPSPFLKRYLDKHDYMKQPSFNSIKKVVEKDIENDYPGIGKVTIY